MSAMVALGQSRGGKDTGALHHSQHPCSSSGAATSPRWLPPCDSLTLMLMLTLTVTITLTSQISWLHVTLGL